MQMDFDRRLIGADLLLTEATELDGERVDYPPTYEPGDLFHVWAVFIGEGQTLHFLVSHTRTGELYRYPAVAFRFHQPKGSP